MTEDEVGRISTGLSDLPEPERIALEYAEYLIVNPQTIDDGRFANLRSFFSEEEVVELSFFVLFYNMLHRFNTSIDLPPPDGNNTVVRHLRDFQLQRD